ncbi:hypothetical protein ACFCWD_35445 [Streptomyces sp. NPDC056374]|uniref:hypothetical protein n=1 Tax=unclassified Streptomyces TaxID=2593676 RepID=UPI0035DC54B5
MASAGVFADQALALEVVQHSVEQAAGSGGAGVAFRAEVDDCPVLVAFQFRVEEADDGGLSAAEGAEEPDGEWLT